MDYTKKMEELIEKMKRAADAYYNGQEIMTDKEYDALFDMLAYLEKESGIILPDSPTANMVGAETKSRKKKITHKYPAKSLNKTKVVEDLKRFLEGRPGRLSWKLDGLTVVLNYQRGKLVSAATRGNGYIGEDITANAAYITGIPLSIEEKDRDVTVRGEAVCSYEAMKQYNENIEKEEDKFKNPRGMSSGSIRLDDPAETGRRKVEFIAFELVEPQVETVEKEMAFLQENGFSPVSSIPVCAENMADAVCDFSKKVAAYGIPTDGLVLTFEDMVYGRSLGETGHHARHSIAFKWQDESCETTLREIFWSTSKTGLINPVAVFNPVEIDGTTICRASIHNVSYMEEMKLEKGDHILVYKANMIIPQIEKNLDAPKKITYIPKIPRNCPICGKETQIVSGGDAIRVVKTLICPNAECAAKVLGSWSHFVSRECMNIMGLGESQLIDLLQAGILKKLEDLYLVYPKCKEQIMQLDGWGEQSYLSILASIEASKRVKLAAFINALGIPMVGKTASKLIAAYYHQDAHAFLEEENYKTLRSIEGIGGVITENLQHWRNGTISNLSRKSDVRLLASLMHFEKEETGNKPLAGKTYVITGGLNHYANRDALIAVIEGYGGKVSGSVSAKTSFLINNDSASSSGKNKKAQSLNVPIITEEQFMDSIK